MKKTILFDIDYTLIDTDLIKENLLTYLCRHFMVDKETAAETRNAYIQGLDSSSDTDHVELIKCFSTKFDQRVEPAGKDFYKSGEVFNYTIYKDVLPALHRLSFGYRIGIYSEGFMKFQRAKLEMNGLIEFFDPELMFIKRRKLDPKVIMHLPTGSVIVDDKREIVVALSKVSHLNPIWLNRGTQQKHQQLKTINSLLEV